jgi:hypothetical protein
MAGVGGRGPAFTSIDQLSQTPSPPTPDEGIRRHQSTGQVGDDISAAFGDTILLVVQGRPPV